LKGPPRAFRGSSNPEIHFQQQKPPISEKNRLDRLAWAYEHIHWIEAQWDRVLWTDETWVNPGRHRKTGVTRKADEESTPECVIDKIPKKIGWMF
jgi:hypothetical protein